MTPTSWPDPSLCYGGPTDTLGIVLLVIFVVSLICITIWSIKCGA